MTTHKARPSGFTIVELLIVVVVIAILAAVSIVAFNGVSKRARESSLQSTLRSTSTQIQTYYTDVGEYPSELTALNNGQGPKVGEDISFAYTQESGSYCLTITSTQYTENFYLCGHDGAIQKGAYASHVALLSGGYPTRGGYTNISSSYGSGDMMRADISSIPNGAWMIMAFTYTSGTSPVTPSGWTPLMVKQTANTLHVSIYAKIKTSGDSNYQEFDPPGASGRLTSTGVLLWGTNGAAVSSWTMGAFGNRANNATQYTVLTPTITVPTAKSLVLSFGFERTNAEEETYTSMVGATPWIWIPHTTDKIQTIAVGYTNKATAGTSTPMTITYPNSQPDNGTAVQIAIPPAS